MNTLFKLFSSVRLFSKIVVYKLQMLNLRVFLPYISCRLDCESKCFSKRKILLSNQEVWWPYATHFVYLVFFWLFTIHTFIHNISPRPISIYWQLHRGRNLYGVPRRDSNSGLPYSKPSELYCTLSEPRCTLSELGCSLSELRCTLSELRYALSELCCTLWATLHPIWAMLDPLWATLHPFELLCMQSAPFLN